MARLLVVFLLSLISIRTVAQESSQLHETAKVFMRQGDYTNAILVLTHAVESDPRNITYIKDLALSYYFQNDLKKAVQTILPLMERDDADDQSYVLAGTIFKRSGMYEDAEKFYKKGLKKYPDNGALYNDLGELLWNKKDFTAIRHWEKGIKSDPSFSRNYYNAAKYYFLSTDKIWSIIYGEIFLNMEPFGEKSPEIKDLLLESYKKLFTANKQPVTKDLNAFENAYLQTILKQSPLTDNGLNAETLTMIRTRFILDWFNENRRPASKLFEYQRQLLQDGLFNAYNQWIFGSSQNLSAFQNWISSHPDEYSSFTGFQKSRIFKIPQGQYYKE